MKIGLKELRAIIREELLKEEAGACFWRADAPGKPTVKGKAPSRDLARAAAKAVYSKIDGASYKLVEGVGSWSEVATLKSGKWDVGEGY